MKPVSRDVILEVWERQCALDEEASQQLALRFLEEQPAVGIYLAAQDELLGDEAAESQLIPLATTIWEAMSRTRGRRLKPVRPQFIERTEATNIRMLQQLDDVREMEQGEAINTRFAGYNQQPLMAFCLEILMADHDDAPELAPERIGMEWILLKTIIDCFDQ